MNFKELLQMKLGYLAVAAVFLTAGIKPVQAQTAAMERELQALREDVQVLQRQAYRDKENGITPASAQDVAVKMGEFDETLRQLVGHVDELEYKLKQLQEKMELMNKDIDVRIKMIEGKPIEGGMGTAPLAAAPKFQAPVAAAAPKSIVGDSIAKGDDLPAVKTESAEQIYQQGLDALNSGNPDLAEQKFTLVMTKFPNHKLAGNAQYWLGEAYYSKKDFAKAAVAFAKGYQKYKNGNKGADSLFKLGMSMKELGKKAEACAAFVSMPKEFPKAETVLTEKAKKQASELKCGQ